MDPLQQLEARLRADPEFQQLDYKNQATARGKLYYHTLQQDPQFAALEPAGQQRAIERFISAATPAYSNPEAAQNFNQLVEGMRNGDRQAAMTSMSIVSQRVGTESSLIAKAASALFPDTAVRGGTEDTDIQIPQEVIESEDTQKFIDYLGYAFADNPELQESVRKQLSRTGTGTAIGGFVADFIPIIATGNAAGAAARGALGARAALTGAKALPMWMATRGLPFVIEETIETIAELSRDVALGNIEAPNAENLNEFALTAGRYAALNYGISATLHGILPFGRSVARVFGRRGLGAGGDIAESLKTVTPDQAQRFEELNRLLERGVDIPDEQLSELPMALADRLTMKRHLNSFGPDIVRTQDPLARAQRAVYVMGTPTTPKGSAITLVPLDDGTFRLIDQGIDSIEILPNMRAVNTRLAELAIKKFEGPENLNRFLTAMHNEDWLMPYINSTKRLDDVLSFNEAIDFTDPSRRLAVTPGEADSFRAAGQAYNIDVPSPPGGNRWVDDATSFDAPAGQSGIAILNNPADELAEQAAREQAQRLASRGAVENLDEATDMILIERGFDGLVRQDGSVRAFFPNRSIRAISTAIDPSTGKALGDIKAPKTNKRFGSAITREYTQRLGREQLAADPKALGDLVTRIGTNPNGTELRKLIGLLTEVEESKVIVKSVDDATGAVKLTKTGDHILAEVPTTVTGRSSQKEFARTLLNQISDIGGPSALRETAPGAVRRAFQAPETMSATARRSWAEGMIAKKGGTVDFSNNQFTVRIGGRTETFANQEQLVNRALELSVTPQVVRTELARRGLRLSSSGGTHRVLDAANNVLYESDDIVSLAKQADLPIKAPTSSLPSDVIIEDGLAQITYEGEAIAGSESALRRFLTKFEDYEDAANSTVEYSSPEGTISKFRNTQTFTVNMPSIGLTQRFDNLAEARRFIERDWAELSNLDAIATRRGLDFTAENGKFVFHGPDFTLEATDTDTLRKALRSYPDYQGGPGFFEGIPDGEYLQKLADQHGMVYADARHIPTTHANIAKESNKLIKETYRKAFAGMDGILDWGRANADHFTAYLKVSAGKFDERAVRTWLEEGGYRLSKNAREGTWEVFDAFDTKLSSARTIEELAEVTEIIPPKLPFGNELMRRLREFKASYSQMSRAADEVSQLATEVFSPGGREIPENIRKAAHYRIIAKQVDWEKFKGAEAIVEAMESPEAIKLEGEIRRLYEMMSHRVGINPLTTIEDYSPRMRRALSKMNWEEAANVDDLLNKIFGGSNNVPPQIRAGFRMQRTDEFVQAIMEDDPMILFQKYNYAAHREVFLNPGLKEIERFIAQYNDVLPNRFLQTYDFWRKNAVAPVATAGEQAIQNSVENLFKKWGASPERARRAGKAAVPTLFTLNYLTNMAFRPFHVVRNLMQPLTTLAMRVDNRHIMGAYEWAADTKNVRNTFNYLKQMGYIQDAAPLVNPMYDASHRLQGLTRLGLIPFKRSDHLDRIIGFRAASQQFEEYLPAFRNGKLNVDEFMVRSRSNTLDPDVAENIRRLLTGSDRGADGDAILKARNQYARTMTDDAFFEYKSIETPQMHQKTLVGKTFGQYGTYAAGFREQTMKMLTHGTRAQRAQNLLRYLGNTVALTGALTAAGMDARNFYPFMSAGFSGGPLFNLGITGLQALGTGYRAQQARYELSRQLLPFSQQAAERGEFPLRYPGLLPGYYQARSIERFLQYADQGDPYLAFLALTSAPIRGDLR